MMLKPDHIYKLIEKTDRAYNIFFGSLLIFLACLILIPNEVKSTSEPVMVCVETPLSSGLTSKECYPQTLSELAKSTDSATQWYMRVVGFIFMLVAAMVMQVPLTQRIRRIPRFSTFSSTDSTYTTILILGSGLTVTAIFIGLIFAYVPFIGYIIAGLFVYGYFNMMQKLSRSKSGVAKAVLVVMMLVVVLILLAIAAFFYLTREG